MNPGMKILQINLKSILVCAHTLALLLFACLITHLFHCVFHSNLIWCFSYEVILYKHSNFHLKDCI